MAARWGADRVVAEKTVQFLADNCKLVEPKPGEGAEPAGSEAEEGAL